MRTLQNGTPQCCRKLSRLNTLPHPTSESAPHEKHDRCQTPPDEKTLGIEGREKEKERYNIYLERERGREEKERDGER